jgi:alginate O-acetyltransferase complex protein AlgI
VTFSSVIFLFLFLPTTLGMSYALCGIAGISRRPAAWIRAANLWLIAASLAFYGWGEPAMLWLLLASAAGNFAAGLMIEGLEGARWRAVLAAAVAANLGVLGWFKYSGLLAGLAARVAAAWGSPSPSLATLSVALPLGISFYTFHGISYIVDVYRRRVPAEQRPLVFCLYFSLFPQLIAGPIVRYSEIAASLAARSVGLDDVYEGMRRFAIGLAKKTLIANPLSGVADSVFAMAAGTLTGAAAWVGVTAYALQIYFDFSGYSDMAIGIGRALGFRFPENFNMPYCAASVRDFWRRWHMTLTRWFRDYLYIPMGGSRRGLPRQLANLVAVFALCGLWHGASWTFLGWGLFHGAFLMAERLAGNRTVPGGAAGAVLSHAYTLAVVWFGWVLFRSESWHQTAAIWRAMLDAGSLGDWRSIPWRTLTADVALAFGVGLAASTPLGPWLFRKAAGLGLLVQRGGLVETAALLGLFLLSVAAVGAGSHNPFIYYRF